MPKNKSVAALLYAEEVDMSGLMVRQPFPTDRFEQIDPFLLLHHADVEIRDDMEPAHAGVGPHPHRGFSPVTFVFKGGVRHRDSRGNDSVIYEGGVQWMNAGMGIIHSERPPDNIQDIGGRQEIIQLWINTPARCKMDIPAYFALPAEAIPQTVSADKLVNVNVVAGHLAGLSGVIRPQSDVNAATILFKKDGHIQLPVPVSHNTIVYLLDGKLNVSGYWLMEKHYAAVFRHDGDQLELNALEESRALLITGEPINEKLATYGPFVMNTQTEILQAMRDYQMGKMGILIE